VKSSARGCGNRGARGLVILSECRLGLIFTPFMSDRGELERSDGDETRERVRVRKVAARCTDTPPSLYITFVEKAW